MIIPWSQVHSVIFVEILKKTVRKDEKKSAVGFYQTTIFTTCAKSAKGVYQLSSTVLVPYCLLPILPSDFLETKMISQARFKNH